MNDNVRPGYAEGEVCNRDGCEGVIAYRMVENCSCHLCAPCGACVNNPAQCPDCGWSEEDEPPEPAPMPTTARAAPTWDWKPRTLADCDRTKIDWISKPHSSCSMIKEGVFPLGTPMDDVRKLVDGTFGGRFDRWDDKRGEFRFIAYTD